MLKDETGGPVVGVLDNMLGARVGVDVRPDAAGNVQPAQGGISVTPEDPSRLPPHLRPIRLGGQCGLPLFKIDDGSLGRALAYLPSPEEANETWLDRAGGTHGDRQLPERARGDVRRLE